MASHLIDVSGTVEPTVDPKSVATVAAVLAWYVSREPGNLLMRR